jgi:hypothetical protein
MGCLTFSLCWDALHVEVYIYNLVERVYVYDSLNEYAITFV